MHFGLQIRKSWLSTNLLASELQVNRRLVSIIEIGIIYTFSFLLVWIISPLNNNTVTIIAAIMAIIFASISHRYHGETFASLGLCSNNFKSSLKCCLPFTIAIALVLVIIGAWLNTLNFSWKLPPKILVYFVWAAFQQFFFLAFFLTRLKDVFTTRSQIAMVSALLFSLIHLPNVTLMIGTFICGYAWALIYYVYPNLYVISISHAALAVLFKYALPSFLVNGLKIGPGYF